MFGDTADERQRRELLKLMGGHVVLTTSGALKAMELKSYFWIEGGLDRGLSYRQ